MLMKGRFISFHVAFPVFIFNCLTQFVQLERIFSMHYQLMNWTDALDFCRERGYELASGTDMTWYYHPHYWIGLHRESFDSDTWIWVDGEEPTYTYWGFMQPGSVGNYYDGSYSTGTEEENCVVVLYDGWHDTSCSEYFNVLCHADISSKYLIQEEKTWEEAIEHCRTFTPVPSTYGYSKYNLPAVTHLNKDTHVLMMMESTTEEVWTGLRFLAGEWRWVTGTTLSDHMDLPACPPAGRHCGTLSKTGDMNITYCDERRNFLCMPWR